MTRGEKCVLLFLVAIELTWKSKANHHQEKIVYFLEHQGNLGSLYHFRESKGWGFFFFFPLSIF